MRCRPGSSSTFLFTLLFGACTCLLTLTGTGIAAEEKEDRLQREQDEAKAEDEADRARGEGFSSEKTFSGRLVLGQVVEGREDIVGLFTIGKGKAYPIKVANEGLVAQMKEHNGKTVSLQGKFRNQGQYFVVTAIIPPPAPTLPMEKLGGL